jgi:uncharacterized repeat protein (TIGR01451 family)
VNCATVTDTVTVNAAVIAVTESGKSTSGVPTTVITNVAANDTVNGVPATLGANGNATVAPVGTYPTGITLDPLTGAIKTSATTPAGVYNITYKLCDKNSPPNCADTSVTVTVEQGLSISGAAWLAGPGGNATNPPNSNTSGVPANPNNVPLPGYVAIVIDASNPLAPIPLGAATVDPLGNYTIPSVPVATAANKGNYRVVFIDPTALAQLRAGNLQGAGTASLQPLSYALAAPGGSQPLSIAGLNLVDSTGKSILPTAAGTVDNANSTPSSVVGGLRNTIKLPATAVSTPGSLISRVDLPIDPSGVVYDSVTRQQIPDPIIRVCRADGTVLSPADVLGGASYTQDGACLKRQYIGNSGVYVFYVNNAATYTISYLGNGPTGAYPANPTPTGTSSLITPQAGTGNNIIGGTNDAINDGKPFVEIQTNSTQPTGGQDTRYFTTLTLTGGVTGGDLINNHLPVDPGVLPKLMLNKTGDKTSAEVGDSIRYTITIKRQDAGATALIGAIVNDYLPAGFRYIDGTAQVNGVSIADPTGKPAPKLVFKLGAIPAGGTVTLTYRVRLGVSAQQGSGINRAQAAPNGSANCTATPTLCSNEAQYKIKVTGGVFSSEACVTGKVYLDCNNNHMQDGAEIGIPGVRMFLENGINFTTDSDGKYSYCGLPPRTSVLVLDPSTLPRGSVMTTSSGRNGGDAMSLFLDLKNGDLQRADFVETSCSPSVIEQVNARKAKGEVNAPGDKSSRKDIEFDSKPATSK